MLLLSFLCNISLDFRKICFFLEMQKSEICQNTSLKLILNWKERQKRLVWTLYLQLLCIRFFQIGSINALVAFTVGMRLSTLLSF